MMKSFLISITVLLGTTALPIHPAAAKPSPTEALLPPSVPVIIGQTPMPVSPRLDQQSFFETGRLRQQDTLMFQRRPREVPPVRADSNSWQFIVFQEGNVSFWMPPGVLTNDTVVLTTTVGEIGFRTLVANDGPHRYIAAYGTDLTPEQVENPEAILTAMRDRVAPPDTFKLTGDRPVQLADYPGVELVFQGETETITMRTFLAGNQVYVVGVVQPAQEPRDRAARAFLNALQVIDQ